MEDVLGGLCTAIANSIRGGLGDIGKINPLAFPGKIDEIVTLLKNAGSGEGGTGGSGGSGSAGDLKFATGFFQADANRSRATVTHGMDTIPDFILVQIAGMYLGDTNEYLEELPLEAAWGFKSTFSSDYLSSVVVPGASFPATTFGIDNAPASYRSNGYIYCPDEKTFEVGAVDANSGMLTNKNGISYRWIAISGLGAAEPVLQNKTITENGTYTADAGFDGLGEVTVEVAGSGGSLPAGVYWRQSDHILDLAYNQSHFVLNDTLYVHVYNKTAVTNQVYKLTSDGYELVCEFGSSSVVFAKPLKHNGVIHSVDTAYSKHYKFDGETFTQLANTPDNYNPMGAFDFNGDLCYIGRYGNLYKYVDAEDSWVDTELLQAQSTSISVNFVFSYKGDIYRLDTGILYKYVNGVANVVVDFGITSTTSGNKIFINGNLYFTNKNGCAPLYKYNIDTGVFTCIGLSPYQMAYVQLFEHEGKLNFASGNNTYQQHLIMHEVTE